MNSFLGSKHLHVNSFENFFIFTMRITKLIYYLPAIVPIEGAVLFELLLMLIVLIRSK